MTAQQKNLLLDAMSAFARFYMAYIWIKAGWSKLGNNLSNTQAIEGYDIFSPTWAGYLAQIIGPAEIAGGLLLLFGVFLRKSAWVSTIVLVLFIIGISQAWARGIATDCGCFGPPEDLADYVAKYKQTILRDVFYIALSLWTAFRPFKKFAVRL